MIIVRKKIIQIVVTRIIQIQNLVKILRKRGRRKFTDGLKSAFSLAKAFILSGVKPNSDIINQLLGTSITAEDLNSLLNSAKQFFPDISNYKKVLTIIRSLCKLYGTSCGVYI